MFGFFTRTRRKPQAPRPRRTLLCLEQLETRDCPAAPVIVSLMGTPQAGQTVWVSGSVADEHPSSVVVTKCPGSVIRDGRGPRWQEEGAENDAGPVPTPRRKYHHRR